MNSATGQLIETTTSRQAVTQLVSFELEQEEYGIDVLAVREIIRMPTITKMPDTPECVDGIINLRGQVVPIVSLRRRFGLEERERDNYSRILVAETAGNVTGFVVDSVAEVLRISPADIQPPPELLQGNRSQECIMGVINNRDRLLVVLEPSCLLDRDEWADAGCAHA